MATLTTEANHSGNQLDKAVARVVQLFCKRVGHGFFDFTISGSITKGGKRSVLITGGEGYKFTIPLEDIPTEYLQEDGS